MAYPCSTSRPRATDTVALATPCCRLRLSGEGKGEPGSRCPARISWRSLAQTAAILPLALPLFVLTGIDYSLNSRCRKNTMLEPIGDDYFYALCEYPAFWAKKNSSTTAKQKGRDKPTHSLAPQMYIIMPQTLFQENSPDGRFFYKRIPWRSGILRKIWIMNILQH